MNRFNTLTASSPSSSNLMESLGFKLNALTTLSASIFLMTPIYFSFNIVETQSSLHPVIDTIFASSKIGEQLFGCAEYSVMHAATMLSLSKASSTVAALTTKPNGLNQLHDTKAILSSIYYTLSLIIFSNWIYTHTFVQNTAKKQMFYRTFLKE